MNISKIIYKSENLRSLYDAHEKENDLVGLKKLTSDVNSKGYLLNIKFLYVYQKCKWTHSFPSWFSTLSQQKLKDLDHYFLQTITNILNDKQLNTLELDYFLDKQVTWLYKGKYRIYPTTPFDYLPLELRLKVYFYLYQGEDDPKACCHLRNRVAITLAKLGHLDLSNLLSVYNWLMAQGINTHFANPDNLKTTVTNHKRLSEYDKELNRLKKEVSLVTELGFFYTNLINKSTMKYDRAHIACLDLVGFYYKQYPQLQTISMPIKTYLRTKDMKVLYDKIAGKRMDYIREVASLPTKIVIPELDQNAKDQLALYNYLLRICI